MTTDRRIWVCTFKSTTLYIASSPCKEKTPLGERDEDEEEDISVTWLLLPWWYLPETLSQFSTLVFNQSSHCSTLTSTISEMRHVYHISQSFLITLVPFLDLLTANTSSIIIYQEETKNCPYQVTLGQAEQVGLALPCHPRPQYNTVRSYHRFLKMLLAIYYQGLKMDNTIYLVFRIMHLNATLIITRFLKPTVYKSRY